MRAPRSDEPLGLARHLAQRLLPISVLIVALVSLSAPVASFYVGVQSLDAEGAQVAARVAELIAREAGDRPLLWRYDTIKLVEHARTYRAHSDVARIDVADADGRAISAGRPAGAAPEPGRVLWVARPIVVNNARIGEVWVGMSTGRVEREAAALLLPFGALGLVLAAFAYWLPRRAIEAAERRISRLLAELDETQRALFAWSTTLEHEVAQRSAELGDALAEVQRKERRLRELSGRAIAMQEAERRSIARELHDSVGQALTAIRIHLQLLREHAGRAPDSAALLARTLDMADGTLEEVRRAARALGPAIVGEVGLAAAVERYCDDFAERTRIAVGREIEAVQASPGIEGACYRILQEALTNVSKHAAAGKVSIRLARAPGGLALAVEDDGRGFDASASGGPAVGRGLAGMRERVELLGGALAIDSSPGCGTRIRILLPDGAE